jgi:hypothetical protein
MTVPVFTHDQFLDYIKSYGWEVKSTEFWNDYNRLILGKNDSIYTFQCKQSGKYFYLEVVNTCKLLKIPPPEEHIHTYFLHKQLYEEACYCEKGNSNGLKFKDCHGKNN